MKTNGIFMLGTPIVIRKHHLKYLYWLQKIIMEKKLKSTVLSITGNGKIQMQILKKWLEL